MGDYSREAINRRTAFIRGMFYFGVMVEYDNLLAFELARGLGYGEERSSWLANRCCYYGALSLFYGSRVLLRNLKEIDAVSNKRPHLRNHKYISASGAKSSHYAK